jgi:hypothetical protein
LHSVALDPNGVGAIVDTLDDVGFGGQDRIVGISKGWKLTGAVKTAERKLADGSLRHSRQGLMAWAVANARVMPKGNAILVTKQSADGCVQCLASMSTNPWSALPSNTCLAACRTEAVERIGKGIGV